MFKIFIYFSITVFYLLRPTMAVAESVLINIDTLQTKMQGRHTHILEVESNRSKPHTDHIPRAFSTQYERDGWLNTESELAGAMPSKARLAQVIGRHGIDKHSDIILVNMNNDRYSLAATLRIYWLLKFAGLAQVSILKGGFASYRNHQAALSTRVTSPVRKQYTTNFQDRLLSTTSRVETALYNSTLLLDFRSISYYEGEQRSEYSQRFGSIPNAENIPWQDLANSHGQLYDFKQLSKVFAHLINDKDSPIICFGEISHHAIIGWFVLSEILKYRNVRLYDDGYLYWQDDLNHLVQNSYETLGFIP